VSMKEILGPSFVSWPSDTQAWASFLGATGFVRGAPWIVGWTTQWCDRKERSIPRNPGPPRLKLLHQTTWNPYLEHLKQKRKEIMLLTNISRHTVYHNYSHNAIITNL
jgi:hypothetical protein